MELTNKQRAFVEEYLRCWNSSEAARRSGYSERSAYSIGNENLNKPEIRAAIEARIQELKASADEVLLRLADHSRGTVDDFVDDDGEISLSLAREHRKMHLVKKLKQTTRTDSAGVRTVTIEIDLHDAQAATVQLGRALGVFVDKIAPTDPSGTKEYAGLTDAERADRLAVILERARARRDGPAPADQPD